MAWLCATAAWLFRVSCRSGRRVSRARGSGQAEVDGAVGDVKNETRSIKSGFSVGCEVERRSTTKGGTKILRLENSISFAACSWRGCYAQFAHHLYPALSRRRAQSR